MRALLSSNKAQQGSVFLSPAVKTCEDGVTTLTMNLPARLNGWTTAMVVALTEALRAPLWESG